MVCLSFLQVKVCSQQSVLRTCVFALFKCEFFLYKLELSSLLSGDIKMTPDQPQTLVSQWHISCVWQLISIQVSKRQQEE